MPGACEKVLSKVRPPSARVGFDVVYMKCAPGYIV